MKNLFALVFIYVTLQACMIHIVEQNDKDKDIEKRTIIVCGKVFTTIQAKKIFPIREYDLDHDGFKEKIMKSENGTEFTLYIISNKKPYVLTVPLYDTEFVFVKDIDKDGIYEIISYDSCYSMIFGLCRACSPAIKYVTHYKDGKLVLQPKLMRDVAPKLHAIPLILNEYGSLNIDEMRGDIYRHARVIEAVLSYFYRGKKYKAIETIAKYIPFQSRAMKVLFLQKLVDAMSYSYFWEQIKKLNDWEKYQNFEIVSELFEEIEKR